VTVDFLAYARSSPKRWDVVAVEAPPLTNVIVFKRVIGLPGESVSLTATGIVVDDGPLRMPPALSNVVYCPPESLPLSHRASFVSFPYTVPSNSFVLPDRRQLEELL